MDVWVLKNVIINNEEHSDGWFFLDNNGNVVHLGGDVKIIRVNDKSLLQKYHEYHREIDGGTYEYK
jgi:hypothetical protein